MYIRKQCIFIVITVTTNNISITIIFITKIVIFILLDNR